LWEQANPRRNRIVCISVISGVERMENSSMEAIDVMSLYEMFQKNGMTTWIDGGWGVDALLGHQTRPHKDLDIVIQEKDVPRLRELLQNRGYQEIKLEAARPHNFVLGDNQGHEIDVHAIAIDANGDGIYGPVSIGEMYPADSLTGKGSIAGTDVRCISPEWLIKFHSGYELEEKDFRDVSALCEKFGVSLPDEYLKFRK
jgi:lincosamide nucleotidyltransferase A/C/D/E